VEAAFIDDGSGSDIISGTILDSKEHTLTIAKIETISVFALKMQTIWTIATTTPPRAATKNMMTLRRRRSSQGFNERKSVRRS